MRAYDFLYFSEYKNFTKYSTIHPDLLYFNKTEEYQKQLNLKYINLTEIEIWRKTTSKYLLIEIPADWEGKCGGFANEMWRFAVIYVWGLQLGRYPGIFNNSAWTCDSLNLPNEIEETFPVVHKIFTYIQPKEIVNNSKYEIYYNKLVKSKEKYLRTPPPPQIHKLFKNVTNQIRELFLFSNKVRTIVDKYINEIFRNDSSHKLCVYTRLGDFGTPKYPKHHPSKKDFTEESTKFVFNEIKEKTKSEAISLVLLGEDKKFISKLKFYGIEPKRVFIPKNMPRGQDIYFSTKICNSLIITASASSFGWWIGYLLNDIKSQVYFHSNFNSRSLYQRSDFPPEWIPLKFNSKKKKITKEKYFIKNYFNNLFNFKLLNFN
uniref:Uncharacterized protein n=1 Tax=Meloidogyne enterolobii TaxID=390850 RepID=A0A6V7TW27_MELEN|nr:unnamed protein product [Meloidogyne enterolobii]